MKTTYTVSNIDALLQALIASPYVFSKTGSRVYRPDGPASENSDWDFVVNPRVAWHRGEVFEALLIACNEGVRPVGEVVEEPGDDRYSGEQRSEDFGRVYILNDAGSKCINLIFPNGEAEYHAWRLTTVEMLLLAATESAEGKARLADKSVRVETFRGIWRVYHRRVNTTLGLIHAALTAGASASDMLEYEVDNQIVAIQVRMPVPKVEAVTPPTIMF